MKEISLILIHLLTVVARLLGPGGVKGIIAENLLLKQQLLVVCRPRQRAPNLLPADRVVFGLFSLFLRPGRIPKTAVAIRPSTLLRFHDYLVRRKYRALFSPHRRGKPGPRGPSQELIDAIVEIKRRNPRFGYPRIARFISKAFGLEIDRNVVRRVLAKYYHPEHGGNSPSWLTFLGHMKDSLWSVDLFRCESIALKSHWVLVVMDQFTRRIIGFAVHTGDVNGLTLCRMFNKIVSGIAPPKYLSSDNDPLFEYHQWQANLRVLDVDEVKTVRGVPVSHPFVERLIGTVRREFLDHILFWNKIDLERKLNEFKDYYNHQHVHASLGGDTPAEVAGESGASPAKIDDFRWQSHCRGLVQLPIAA
jgi:transposase InsO family protein